MSEEYRFNSKDFYALLNRQDYTCPLTGRKLTPESTRAELIQPKELGGLNELKNIYLVDREVAKLKRSMTQPQILELARDIIKTCGKAKRKSSKQQKK